MLTRNPMLTRHLYVDTEVQAALAYAILKGRSLEAAFWCDELVATDLEEAAWTTLLETWLWQALVTCPDWGTTYYKQGSLVDAAHVLCGVPKDNSLWWVLVSCLNGGQPGRITYRGWEGVESADECFRLAVLQKKARLAWWLVAQGLTRGLVANGLTKGVVSQNAATSLVHPTVAHCASVLLACCDCHFPSRTQTPFLPPERSQWLEQTGNYKLRRRYPIPVECLYGREGRGRLPQTASTLPSLWALEATLRAEQNTFWSARLPSSDDTIDAFYATYFPDDLPEECLTAAQERFSHGPGLLRPSEQEGGLSWARLCRIWFRSESRFAWGFYEWPESLPPTTQGTRFEQVVDVAPLRLDPSPRFTPVRPKIEVPSPLSH